MAYYRTCTICGCNLDPGETCDCEKVSRENKLRFEKLTKIRAETKQMEFNFNAETKEVA